MANIGELTARLTLDSAQFDRGLALANAAMSAATAIANGLSSALNAVGNAARAAGSSLAAGLGAAVQRGAESLSALVASMDAGKIAGALSAASSAAASLSSVLAAVGTAATVAGAALAAGFGAAVVSGVETAASMQQVQLGFEALLGSASAATEEISKLNAMAAATPFEFKDLVKGEQQLLAAGKSLNLTADGARALLTAVGDRVALMGGSADQVKLVDLALSQMMMKGRVMAQEMNQMAESGFDPWQRLSAELGVSVAQAQDMVTKGLVPAAKMMQAIVNQPGAALGAMQKQSQTLIGLFSTLKDVVGQGLGKAAQPLVEALTDAMPAVTTFTGTLIAAMDPLIRGMGAAATVAAGLLKDFNGLNPLVQQFALYGAVAGIAIVAGLSAIGVALLSLVPAVASVATAFAALDASAAPILLLAAAIGATAVIAFGPWVAWFSIISAGIVAVAAVWYSNFAGLGDVITGLGRLLYDLAKTAIGAVYDAIVGLSPALQGFIGAFSPVVGIVVQAAEAIQAALTSAFSVDGILSALTTIKTAMIDTATSVLSTLNATISAALPMLAKLGAGGSATATQGAILSSMLQLSSMRGAVEFPPEVAESMTAASAAATDYRNSLDALLEGLDGTSKKGNAASASAKEHAKAMKEEEKAAKEAADALRDYVKLYEDAASAVYAKRSDPTAQFQKQFESSIADLMPKFELTASDRLDMAEADLAVALSRGAIDMQMYNDDMAEINVARLKIEKDYNDKQKAATAKMVAGVGEQALGIVKSMGKLGSLVSAAQEGAKAGGAAGAVIAVLGQLLQWNEKFQAAVGLLDEIIQGAVGALDGLVAGLAPLMRAVGTIVSTVLGGLTPVFTALGNVLVMLTPIISVVGSILMSLSGVFSIFSGILTAISPILYAAFDIIDTVLRGVAIVILGVMYGIEVAYNAILEAVASVLEMVGANKAAKNLRNQKADAKGTLDEINKLISTSYEDALASQDTGLNAVASAAGSAAEGLDALTQSLSNVPTGFKLNKYIYDAAQGTSGASGASGASGYTGGASAGGNSGVVIGSVIVNTSIPDAPALVAALTSIAKKKAALARYNPGLLTSRWGTS